VVYLDFFDMNTGVLSCPPGENSWHREEFGLNYFGLTAVADDEHEVGVVHAMENPIMDAAIFFSKGDPRIGPARTIHSFILVGTGLFARRRQLGPMVNDEDRERVTYYGHNDGI
jgi:hypothetical protein